MRYAAFALAKFLLTAAATSAYAFDSRQLNQVGSLSLSDLGCLVTQSAALKRELNLVLAAAKKSADDISCYGFRFPGTWTKLGGIRVGPYWCQIGDKWLVIETVATVSGDDGTVYNAPTRKALQNADDVTELAPKWRWADAPLYPGP